MRRLALIFAATIGLASAAWALEPSGAVSIQAEMRMQTQTQTQTVGGFGNTQLAVSGEPFDTPTEKAPVKQQQHAGRKKAWKALALSALIPGAGEYYMGHRGRARIFFSTEALSWIGLGSFRMYGHWRKDDMIRWARDKAGADLNGKSDFYQDMVGFYDDIDHYNTFGRVMDPERPYLFDTPENHWRWQDTTEQRIYRDFKNQSREAYRRANFMVGVMVVSRIISVADVFQMVLRSRGKFDDSFSSNESSGLRVQLYPYSPTQQVVVSLPVSF